MDGTPNRVKELRLERGWSLSYLEERAGIPRNSINLIERGKQELTLDNMRRFGRAFSLPPTAVLNAEDVEFRPSDEHAPVLDALRHVPAPVQAKVLHAALAVLDISQSLASPDRVDDMTLTGRLDARRRLATLWNGMDQAGQERSLGLLEATGFSDPGRRYADAR